MRVPPMHPVHDLLPEPGQCRPAAGGDPHSRHAARPAAKSATSSRPSARSADCASIDDAKRLERDYPEQMAKVRERCGAKEDSLLVLAAWAGEPKGHRPEETVYQACGQLRLFAAKKFNDRHKLLDPKNFQFLWVVDFPMFEWDDEDNRWMAAHHPFTSVHDEDLEKLTTDPARCRAKSYDLVLNGMELGSGSIRIHRRDMQAKVFEALGFSDDEARRRFGYLLDALEYGAPPHGGIALGPRPPGDDPGGRDLDPRSDSIPQDRAGTDLMCDAPSDARTPAPGICISVCGSRDSFRIFGAQVRIDPLGELILAEFSCRETRNVMTASSWLTSPHPFRSRNTAVQVSATLLLPSTKG